MTFLVLRPDDHFPRALQHGEAPSLIPGTIIALPASLWSIEEDLESFSACALRHPWVPAVIIEDAEIMPRGLGSEAIHLLAACCDVRRMVYPPPTRGRTSTTAPADVGFLIRRTIRSRVVPTGEEICRYFGRSVPESARSDVVRVLTWACGPGGTDRALSRRLVRNGLPAARNWRVASRTIQAVAHGILDGRGEGAAADNVGLQVKALSRACGRQFGAPWRDLVAVGVWEGVAELFLRAHQRAPGTTGRVRTMSG